MTDVFITTVVVKVFMSSEDGKLDEPLRLIYFYLECVSYCNSTNSWLDISTNDNNMIIK